MKFDKETVIVIVICLAVLLGWAVFYPKWQAEKVAAAQQEQLAAQKAEVAASKISAVSPAVVQPVQTVAAPAKTKEPVPVLKIVSKAYSLSTKNTDYFFNSAGILEEIVLKNHKTTGDNKPIVVRETAGFEPLSVVVPGLGVKSVRIDRKNDQELVVTKVFAGTVDLVLVKTFSVTDRSNILNCRIEI